MSTRTKTQELSIFTMGIGGVLITLTAWLAFTLNHSRWDDRFSLMLTIPIGLGALYIVLGLMIRKLKTPSVLRLSAGLIALGLCLDLFLSFNIAKAFIDLVVIGMVLRTTKGAIEELTPNISPQISAD